MSSSNSAALQPTTIIHVGPPAIQNSHKSTLTLLAIGAIVALAGFFLTLAAFQILPQGINAISNLGIWGYVTGFGTFGIGGLTALVTAVRWYCTKSTETTLTHREHSPGTQSEGSSVDSTSTSGEGVDYSRLDFSQITPNNLDQYFDTHQTWTFENTKIGDFQIEGSGEDPSQISGHVFHKSQYGEGIGCLTSCLSIHEGQFAQHISFTLDSYYTFSNLKEYFDHLFAGKYRFGKKVATLEFVRLKTVTGEYLIYPNPYLRS